VTQPSGDVEVALGATGPVTVSCADADPDDIATTDILADQDGDLTTAGDQIPIATGRPEQDGASQSLDGDVSAVPAGTYRVFALTTDPTHLVSDGASGLLLVNTPPTLDTTAPAATESVSRGATQVIRHSSIDPDDAPIRFSYADRDGLLTTTGDSHVVGIALPEPNGASNSISRDTTEVEFGTYRIVGLVWDGTSPPTERTATGRVSVVNSSLATSAGGTELDRALGVGAFPDGSSVAVGFYSAATSTFGAGESAATTLTADGLVDAFFARYGSDGALVWAKQSGGPLLDHGRGVAALPDGGCAVAGFFDSAAVFGIGDPNETVLFSTSARDVWVARLDADGALRWVSQAGGSSTEALAMAMDPFPDGSLGSAGYFDDGGVVCGDGSLRPWPVVSAGLDDVFVARYNAVGGF
jgi:hypothetical protein